MEPLGRYQCGFIVKWFVIVCIVNIYMFYGHNYYKTKTKNYNKKQKKKPFKNIKK